MRIAYLRVSTEDQSPARQEIVADKFFEEKASGATRDRPALTAMLEQLRNGDEVYVWSLDRLARSLVDLEALIFEIQKRGASLHAISENLVFRPENDDPFSALTMRLLGSVAQFERDILARRQREGIKKAKASGKYKGRKRSIDRKVVCKLFKYGLSRRQIALQLDIARSSVSRILAEGREGVANSSG